MITPSNYWDACHIARHRAQARPENPAVVVEVAIELSAEASHAPLLVAVAE